MCFEFFSLDSRCTVRLFNGSLHKIFKTNRVKEVVNMNQRLV